MSAPDGDPVQDPGLQAERTRLAWSRTALALLVVGTLELHPTSTDVALVHRVPALLTMLCALACWVHGGRRYRGIRARLAAGHSIAPRHSTVVTGALVVLPVAIALWAVWV